MVERYESYVFAHKRRSVVGIELTNCRWNNFLNMLYNNTLQCYRFSSNNPQPNNIQGAFATVNDPKQILVQSTNPSKFWCSQRTQANSGAVNEPKQILVQHYLDILTATWITSSFSIKLSLYLCKDLSEHTSKNIVWSSVEI